MVSAIGANTKILIRRKLVSFVFIITLMAVLFFSSLFVTKIPPFAGFIIFASIFLVMDICNIFYSIFFGRVSSLTQEKIFQEVKGLPILMFLSFALIIGAGSMMNIPLTNYTTQLGQLSLIAGLLLIINEFWISLSIGKFYNSARKNLFIPLKQKYTNNVRGEIISVVVHVITLFSVASKLPRPHDFISFGYLFLILVLGVLYGIKKFKEVTSTTS